MFKVEGWWEGFHGTVGDQCGDDRSTDTKLDYTDKCSYISGIICYNLTN